MKLLFSLILLGITVSVYGQGEVNFQNRNTSITPAINAPISYDGSGPVPAQKIDGDNTFTAGPYTYGGIYARAALYGGPAGTPEHQLVLLGPAVGFRTNSTTAGYIIQETNPVRVVEGVLPGAPAVFQVRAWDAGVSDVDSYEEAEALIGSEHLVYRGKSPLLSVPALGGGGAPPADLIGLEPFSISGLPLEPPTPYLRIDVPPSSQTVIEGTNVTLRVVVWGTPLISYQWLFNSNPLPSATTITPAIDAPIFYDGTGPVSAQRIDGAKTCMVGPYTYGGIYARAALYGGPAGTPEEQLVLLGPAVGFRTTTAAGYIIQETNPVRVVQGVLPGAPADFQVRAWDAGVPDVDSYEEAQALIGACHPVYFNRSPLLNVAALGGDGAPPADLIGLQAFSLSALPMESPTPATIRVSPQSRLATAGENVTLNVVVEGCLTPFLINGCLTAARYQVLPTTV